MQEQLVLIVLEIPPDFNFNCIIYKILKFGYSTKPVENEMKMPMLFDTKEKAENEAYKFCCKGAHQMGYKWMPCIMHKHNH